MSDKIALLAGGELVQYGSPETLYMRPVNDVTAEFLGESNLFRGTLVRLPDSWAVEDGDFRVEVTDEQADRFREGNPAVAVIRPWSVSVLPAAQEGTSGVHGTVAAVIYAGESQKVLVSDGSGREYIVRRTLEDELSVDVGDRVALSWRPEHVVVTRPAENA